jgi:hypothetical protein
LFHISADKVAFHMEKRNLKMINMKFGMEWNGMEWNGMEWNGMEWNGMEWNGIMGNGNHGGSDLKPSHAFCRWRGCPLPKSPMHSLCPTYILRKVYLLDTFMPVEYIFQTVLNYFVSSYQPDVAGLMMFNFLSSSFSFFSSPFFTSFFF